MRPAAALAAMALAACSPAELPPPAAPPIEMPAVAMPNEAPAPAQVRVVLDTPRDHARIERLSGTQMLTDSDGSQHEFPVFTPICSTTPCVHDFSRGPESLRFISLDSPFRQGTLQLEVDRPVVVRHVIEQTTNRRHAPWVVTLVTGSASGLAGIIVPPIGASAHSQATVDVGVICAGTGAALLVTSFLLMSAQRGEHRPPATTLFPLNF